MGESPDERMIRSYLLGDMPAEERAAFQQRIFEDDDVFHRVLAVEDEMADAMARNQLPPEEAARVRTFLEESSQKDRIATARAFALMEQGKSAPRHVPSIPVWRRALPLAACLILAIAALWLALRNRDLQTQIAQIQPAPGPSASAGIFSTRVAAGTLRGSDTRPAIVISQDARIVELRLEVRSPGVHPRYRIDVARTGGDSILSINLPAPLPAELAVPISRAALTPGSYEITLSALDDPRSPTPIEYYYCTFR